MCARHTRALLVWDTTASTPKAILQLPVELRVRFTDLLMAFEGWSKTCVLVSHDGFETQAIRKSPHKWPHCCPVAGAFAATEAAGAEV